MPRPAVFTSVPTPLTVLQEVKVETAKAEPSRNRMARIRDLDFMAVILWMILTALWSTGAVNALLCIRCTSGAKSTIARGSLRETGVGPGLSRGVLPRCVECIKHAWHRRIAAL